MCKMFKVFVRPEVEYASQIWNPVLLKDIKLLESVQRKYTKRIPGLHGNSYNDRLKKLNLETLEFRRLMLDLIFLYKLLNGKFLLDWNQYFKLKTSVTRGHKVTLRKPPFKKDIRKHFFTNRVIDLWNSLPQHVVLAPTVSVFKELLKTNSIKKGIKSFIRGEDFEV